MGLCANTVESELQADLTLSTSVPSRR